MTFITLDEAKAYLRVDTADEDAVIGSLLNAAGRLCRDVARLSSAQWEDIDSDKPWADTYAKREMTAIRETLRVAVLYALGYLYEHREEADHHELTLTLRSLLFAVREGVPR